MTSSKASIISAWVSMGARYHHQLNSVSRQKRPSSASVTLRSLSDFRMSVGVESLNELKALNRLSAMARWPCVWRQSVFSQCWRDCLRKKSTADLFGGAMGASLRKKLRL